MKQHGDRDAHIRSNVDELNRYLQTLSAKMDPECAKVVIRDMAYAILADLKLNSPVVTGNLRGNWNLTEIANASLPHLQQYRVHLSCRVRSGSKCRVCETHAIRLAKEGP